MDQPEPKIPIIKKFLWLGLIIIIVLSFIIYSNVSRNPENPKKIENKTNDQKESDLIIENNGDLKKVGKTELFTEAQLLAAEKALAAGIRIEDGKGDFFIYSNLRTNDTYRGNNPNPYPLPFTDMKSVSIGADNDYLYLKFEFWDKFPADNPSYEGDYISSIGAKLDEITFRDESGRTLIDGTGDGVTYAHLEEAEKEGKVTRFELVKPIMGTMTWIVRNDPDPSLDEAFEIASRNGIIAGGPGYDYILSARNLSEMKLIYGQEILFRASTETNSLKHHHEVIEFLLGKEEQGYSEGALIKYKLGEDTYHIVKEPEAKEKPADWDK